MNISEAMTPDPACCTRGDSVQAAAIIMRELSVGVVPVIDSDDSQKLVGVVTDRDLCMDVVAEGKNPADTKVGDCMTTELITCHPNDDIEQVAHMMQQNQIRRVPVVDDDFHLKGIVSMADIVLCGDLPSEEIDETMRDISEPTFEEFQHLCALDAISIEEQK
ncbi:MAG TPA: CBS domain-containing protein [Candidatus Obscuribacterales bacterium]